MNVISKTVQATLIAAFSTKSVLTWQKSMDEFCNLNNLPKAKCPEGTEHPLRVITKMLTENEPSILHDIYSQNIDDDKVTPKNQSVGTQTSPEIPLAD